MAFGIFRLSLVFTIGLYVGLASGVAEAVGINEISLSLSLKDPKDVILVREQNVVLRCEAKSSSPGLSISWLYEGSPLSANDSRIQLLSDGSLNVSKTTAKKMAGQFRCLARNDVGAILSSPAQLQVAAIGRDFVEQPDNRNASERQPVIFPCRLNSIPEAVISWERDNKTLPQNARYVPLPSGSLLITSTHSVDAGLYRCVARHKILKKTKRSKSGQLLVSPPPSTNLPPKFLLPNVISNVTALSGDNVTLVCSATGWPSPSVQWIYNSEIVISNGSVLQLQNVTTYLSGNYSCIANNIFGKIAMNYTLTIYEVPRFNVTPVSISYPSARTVRLDCKVTGSPTPEVSWLKNGVPLELIGRIKQQNTSLVLSHSLMSDAGIYQCVASNAVGQIWTAARLLPIFSPNRPNPPQNVTCQPYDDNSICLTWESSPNVTIQAYSIFLFNAVKGYDFVTNYTYYLANGLEKSSEYVMYVRSYSNEASEESNIVSCKTGVQGDRNLTVEFLSESSVRLVWSSVSNDFPCGNKKHLYKIQWRKFGQSFTYLHHTSDFKKVITRLQSSSVYEFRVQSTTNKNDPSPWITYFPPSENSSSSEGTVTPPYSGETENQTVLPSVPIQVEVEPLSPHSVNLTWTNLGDEDVSYTVYCTDVKEKNSRIIESPTNSLEVLNLKPNTLYAFKVRLQNGPFSKSVMVQTPAHIPSTIQNLRSRIVNASTACVTWKSPVITNGKLINYVVSYTSNKELPLEKWHNTYVEQKDIYMNQCWSLKKDEVSMILNNLSAELDYTLVVRAVTDAGSGDITAPITFSTHSKAISSEDDSATDMDYKQKLGVAVGVSISALCIFCCISCMIFRRRCMKRQAARAARLTASNNYYASQLPCSGAALHMHQDSCVTEAHEMQQLVMNEGNTDIPPIETTHLDTKGGIGFPNGQLNGSLKYIPMNGHIVNGHIHITENPQYDYHPCNGNLNSKKNKKDCLLPPLKHLSCLQENATNNKYDFNDGLREPMDYVPNAVTSDLSLPAPLKVFDVSDYNSNCNSEFVGMYNAKDGENDTQITYIDKSFPTLPNGIVAPNG